MNKQALESFINTCNEMMVPVQESVFSRVREYILRKKYHNKEFIKPEKLKEQYKDTDISLQEYIAKYSKDKNVINPYFPGFTLNKEEAKELYEKYKSSKIQSIDVAVEDTEKVLECLYLLNLSKNEFGNMIKCHTNKYENYVVEADQDDNPVSQRTQEVIDYFKVNKFMPVCADGGGNTLYYSAKLERFYDMFHERYAFENLVEYTKFKDFRKTLEKTENYSTKA